MTTMGKREFSVHVDEAIEKVQAGETIEITDSGRVVARLVPAQRPIDIDERRAALADLDVLIADIGKEIKEPGDIAQVISDMRR